jgi:hypothetical protein
MFVTVWPVGRRFGGRLEDAMCKWRRIPAKAMLGVVAALTMACDDDEGPGRGSSPEQAGQACVSPADCYPEIEDRTALAGEIECLDRVDDGYCTHQCETDADCCAVPGECDTPLPQVCAPFESTGLMLCFLSCESDALDEAEAQGYEFADEAAFCQRYAHPRFGCRSTGGGSENRRVCVP